MSEITIEVKISLEDFFNSDLDRQYVFMDAMQSAILCKLNDSKFVQQNIAHYLFSFLQDEQMNSELDKIKSVIREKLQNFKEPDDWTIRSNDIYKKCINDALGEIKDDIMDATKKKAIEFMNDDGKDYKSFYGKVADAMVDKVFENFVDAMVKKELNK